MKPKPFAALKNLTVPVVMVGSFHGVTRTSHSATAGLVHHSHCREKSDQVGVPFYRGRHRTSALHTHLIWACMVAITRRNPAVERVKPKRRYTISIGRGQPARLNLASPPHIVQRVLNHVTGTSAAMDRPSLRFEQVSTPRHSCSIVV